MTEKDTCFHELATKRRSCRAFDPSREVAMDLVQQCLEAARLAPSACNRQPWRFIIVQSAATRQAICQRGLLPGIKQEWLTDAPVIAVLCVKRDLVTHRLAPVISGVPYYLIDAGIAGEHFVLQATELGLGTCWIGWFSEKQIRKELRIPRGVQVVSLIALGYPTTEWANKPNDEKRTARLPIDEIAFSEQWGGAVKP
jgi:nitroreductase